MSRHTVRAPYPHPDGDVAAAFAARIQELEAHTLSPLATLSYPAAREHEEPDCGLRTPFQRDRDRIVHSKSFRRLKHKTQVFVSPAGDHYRTRLTHTLEVTQVSRTVARALRLNEDLVEAIGLGHDLGHPPFGHIGEDALDRCVAGRFGGDFRHYEHSLRVVERLERDGQGLNLTEPVRDGIVSHSGRSKEPATLEGKIVRLVDRVVYINHDIDDRCEPACCRPATCRPSRSPSSAPAARGGSTRSSTTLSRPPSGRATSSRATPVGAAMAQLRAFMFERVYLGPEATREHAKIDFVIRTLFERYCANPEMIPDSVAGGDLAARVTDHIAGMTDRFCIAAFEALCVPAAFAP